MLVRFGTRVRVSHNSLTRHPSKGEWIGATRVEHLGNVVDTATMKFDMAPRKAQKVKSITKQLLNQFQEGRRWVSRDRLRSF
jgi:hypothetical protein